MKWQGVKYPIQLKHVTWDQSIVLLKLRFQNNTEHFLTKIMYICIKFYKYMLDRYLLVNIWGVLRTPRHFMRNFELINFNCSIHFSRCPWSILQKESVSGTSRNKTSNLDFQSSTIFRFRSAQYICTPFRRCEMVFCLQNCSDLLRENLKFFWDH